MNTYARSIVVKSLLALTVVPCYAIASNANNLVAVSGAVSAVQPLGRFELFASVPGNQGGIYHTWQLSDKAGWQPIWQKYTPAPDDVPHGLVAGRDGIGRVMVAWISGGSICFAEAIHPDASLLTSNDLCVRAVIDPDDHKNYRFTYLALGRYPTGRLEVLALVENGRVWSIRQFNTVDDGKPWIGVKGSAVSVGGTELQNISVTNLNAGLALVATGKDGKVYVKNQATQEFWDPEASWTFLGGNHIQDVRAKESRDHQLEIVAYGADKHFYLQFQNVGSNIWSGWETLLTGEKYGPSYFFDRCKDGSLFVTTHFDLSNSSQFKGTFAKAFQSPNNGAWADAIFRYQSITSHDTGVTNPDDLEFLSADAFALAADGNGDINYFVSYRNGPQVEHYIDNWGASPGRFLHYQESEHTIPNLP